jgi:hypothetical protein
VLSVGMVVEDAATVVVVVDGARVVEVVVLVVVVVAVGVPDPLPPTAMGVVSPGAGFHPLGGLVCEGTGGRDATTTGGAGWATEGG